LGLVIDDQDRLVVDQGNVLRRDESGLRVLSGEQAVAGEAEADQRPDGAEYQAAAVPGRSAERSAGRRWEFMTSPEGGIVAKRKTARARIATGGRRSVQAGHTPLRPRSIERKIASREPSPIEPDGVGEVGSADRRIALAVAAMAVETLPSIAEERAAMCRSRAVGGATLQREQVVDESADLSGVSGETL